MRHGSPGLVGRRLGAYELHAHLGSGGMGDVYRARDIRLGRDVAIKILTVDPSPAEPPDRRFQREAHAIASLNHPHICVLHDIGQVDGINYLVMEYLEGKTLKQRLLEGAPLPLDETLTVAGEIADALAEAHRHGIVHRDVKPGNVILAKGGAKLLDFGLARSFGPVDSQSTDMLTSEAVVLGTPSYMSPEQILQEDVDAQSDVFSLGVVVYEMVTGRRPFDGATVPHIIDAVLHRQPEPVSVLNPAAPSELGQLVSRCLEKDKKRRYRSVDEVWTDLMEVGRGSGRQRLQPRGIRRHNLPLQLTSFIGREREVDELCSLLCKTRLLTLAGSGGCGKTRLSLAVASNVVDRFADGIWLTELASISNEELVPQSVAAALGVQEDPGRPLLQRLEDYLEAKQLLLMLDNCEHLVSATARFVETILRSCPGVRILVTSREPLRIRGELLWRVPSLSVPDSAAIPLPQVREYEAVRLFMERARSVSSLQLDDYSAHHVIDICQRLDGIPLALEMAAARLDVLSLDQITDRLADRFRLLTGTDRTSLPRQETLRSTIDWSYGLLSPAEQTLFRRLAVFAGGFSLEAVEAVCADHELKSEQILEILSRLVDKSMVTIGRTSLGVRYRLLETVSEYARDKLRHRPDERRTKNKHLDFVLAFVERLEPEFYGSQTARCHDRVELDHQNVLAALEWGHTAPRRSQAALRLAGALMLFWAGRCYHQLAKHLLLRALDRDQRRASKPVLIKALDAAGYFLRITGELDAARLAHEEARSLAEESGDQNGLAKTLWQLGIIALMQGRESEAEALQRHSLAISRKHGFKLTMASALDNLGIHAYHRGEYATAQSYWQESHDLFRELGFDIGLTLSLLHHTALACRTDLERARLLATEALAKARETGHKGIVSSALIVLANVYANTADYRHSRALCEQALAIVREAGYKRHIARALLSLGSLSSSEGKYVEADRLLNECLTLLTQLQEDESADAAECLQFLGWIALHQGRVERALGLCQRALAFERSTPGRRGLLRLAAWIRLAQDDYQGARATFQETRRVDPAFTTDMASLQIGIGYLDLLDGRVREAQAQFRQALAVSEGDNDKARMIESLLALGDASLHDHQLDEAASFYLRALGLARDMDQKRDIARAVRNVGIIAARQHRPELATWCFGASSVLLNAVHATLLSFESIGYDAAVAAVRSEIGEARFQSLWQDGGMIPLDAIIELFDEGCGFTENDLSRTPQSRD